MGVRGLSTFVKKNKDAFLTKHKLCNEIVVIDGDNLIYYINNHSRGINHAFGGDYQKYAKEVEEFFDTLSRCRITPIVLFDGGSDPSNRKLKTAFARLADKLEKTAKLCPSTQHRIACLPLLSKAAFIEVLRGRAVAHAVCPFEADEPLAALARLLHCPVISDDTDFFAFGVRCVLLSSLAAAAEQEEPGGQWHVDCVIFRHDRFMSHYGLKPRLMPLLACLLGNDYISPAVVAGFVSHHVPRPYGERRGRPAERRIGGLLAWLRRHDSPGPALDQVIMQLKKEQRAGTLALLQKSMSNYDLPSTGLLQWLSLPEELMEKTRASQESSYLNAQVAPPDSERSGADETVPPSSAAESLLLDGRPLPGWLADCVRRGACTGDLVNLITGQPLLQQPQVGDPRLEPACVCVEPLLRWQLVCVHGSTGTATVYRRRGPGRTVSRLSLSAASVEESGEDAPPRVWDVAGLGQGQRRRLLMSALGMEESRLQSLPEQTHLLAAVLGYWCRHGTGTVTSAHVGALLLTRWRAEEPGLVPLAAPSPSLLSGETSVDRLLLHQLAQLQCVVAQAGNISCLLGSPLAAVSPARLLAGPLVYNAAQRLRAAGLASAAGFLTPPRLNEWRDTLQALCGAAGIPMEMPALAKGSRAKQQQRKRSRTRRTCESSCEEVVERSAVEPVAAGGRRRQRRQPQLGGNQFAALLLDSDGTASDAS